MATWNVNSVKQRIPRLLPWLDERSPDVVCLQETKLSDDVFDTVLGPEFTERGYEFAHVGQGQWNGVAILSKVGLDDVVANFDGAPGFPDPASAPEARAVSAVCGRTCPSPCRFCSTGCRRVRSAGSRGESVVSHGVRPSGVRPHPLPRTGRRR